VKSPVKRLEEALNDSELMLTDRDRLLADLSKVRGVGFKKLELRNTTNGEKIAWSRVIVSSCGISDQILRSKDQDELVKRVKDLEEAMSRVGKTD
jgi:hypothetical protein